MPERQIARALRETEEPPRKILVVDDAPMFREIETLFLGRTGQIFTACDGTDALEIAQREQPDLVLTDLSMLQMDGDELCRRIRRDPDLRRVPVIVVTGGRSPDEHERAVLAGADDVIEKPLSRVSLLQAVQRLLRLTVRGLDRVPFETDVRISVAGTDTWAWSRNVSRGGIFIEAEHALAPDTELDLEFAAPETALRVAPTARVVWRRPDQDDQPAGMGLQFLKLDREAMRWLDQYVYELAKSPAQDPAPPP